MRARFWRNKSPHLANRLLSVVETAERSRRTMPPRPHRVEIDTTYAAADMEDPAEVADCPFVTTAEPLTGREHAVRRLEAAGQRLAAEQEMQNQLQLMAARQQEADRRLADAMEDLDALRIAAEQRERLLRQGADAHLAAVTARFQHALTQERSLREAAETALREAEEGNASLARELAREKEASAKRVLAERSDAERFRATLLAELATADDKVAALERDLSAKDQAINEAKTDLAKATAVHESAVGRERAARAESETLLEQANCRLQAMEAQFCALRDEASHRERMAASPDHEIGQDKTSKSSSLREASSNEPSSSSQLQSEPMVAERIDSSTSELADEPPASDQPTTRLLPAGGVTGADQRRDRRIASGLPATLWREGMSQALVCTIRDRSSSGAKLEFQRDHFSGGSTELVIGDRLTLTMNAAQERTSVACAIVWIAGNRCGVTYAGQFVTQPNAPKRATASDKIHLTKASKPTSAARRLAKSLLSG